MSLPDIQAVEIYDRKGLLIGRLSHPAHEAVSYAVFTSIIPV